METFSLFVSLLSFLLSLGVAVDTFLGFRRLTRLEDVAPTPGPLPRVSIVFGARDEETALEEAVWSHLAQDYPDFEVLAVDDRSSDRTPAILTRLASLDARLRVLRIDALPPGWLGKCNALHRGVQAASGAPGPPHSRPLCTYARAAAPSLHSGLWPFLLTVRATVEDCGSRQCRPCRHWRLQPGASRGLLGDWRACYPLRDLRQGRG